MSDFFATCPSRAATDSEKWERFAGNDVLPLWVADMDLQAPDFVQAALRQRLDHGVYGYAHISDGVRAACCAWLASRFHWQVAPEALVFLPGVVCGLHAFARAVAKSGEAHQVLTPIYPPFLSLPEAHGHKLERVELSETDRGFRLEPRRLGVAASRKTRSLLLCQPHNPTGRVFDAEELAQLAEHARRYDLFVCSDEIWADLVLDGTHRPFALAAPDLADRTVTLMAPSKTFNIPGLACAVAIIPGARLRRSFQRAAYGVMPHPGALGLLAAEAAWREGGPWVDALIPQLRARRDRVQAVINQLPKLRCFPGESTYLSWIDARGLGVADPDTHFQAHGLGLSGGPYFGAPGWLRLNFATSWEILEEALSRLRRAVEAVQ